MTLAATPYKKSYDGDGVTTIYPVPFYFLEDGDIRVNDVVTATGIPTPLVLGIDYTLVGAGVLAGGSLTRIAATLVGHTLVIERSLAGGQPTHFVDGDPLPAAGLEQALDRLGMLYQQAETRLDRSVSVPLGLSVNPAIQGAPTPGYALGVDASGTGFTFVPNTGADQTAALGDAASPIRGAGMVAHNEVLTYPAGSAGKAIQNRVLTSDLASIALGKGAALIGYEAPFAGAIPRTQKNRNDEFVSVIDAGVVGDGVADDTAALNIALGWGGMLRVPAGKVLKISSVCLMVIAGTMLFLEPGATINFTQAMGTPNVTNHGIRMTAAGCSIVGHNSGSLNGPVTWDGLNSSTNKSALVQIEADGCAVLGVTLNGIPRWGVSFYGAQGGQVIGCKLYGNYPAASYNASTTTSQFGINIDFPSANPDKREYLIQSNIIESCIQGVFVGDTVAGGGIGSAGSGVNISGNDFSGCHNHGIYDDGGTGHVIVGNSFSRCADPIVIAGSYHVVQGNTMTTYGTGNNLDLAGISLRNPVGCIVRGNTMYGDAGTGQTLIDVKVDTSPAWVTATAYTVGQRVSNGLANYICLVAHTSGTFATDLAASKWAVDIYLTTIKDNLIEGNVIESLNGSSNGIMVNTSLVASTLENNVIRGNKIKVSGQVNGSQIAIFGNTGAGNQGQRNVIQDNIIVGVVSTNGIRGYYQNDMRIEGNTWALGAALGAADTLNPITLTNVTWSRICGNKIIYPAIFGNANCSPRGINEGAGCDYNTITDNQIYIDAAYTGAVSPFYIGLTGASTTCSKNRCGTDPMSGQITMSIASPTATITSKNIQAGTQIMLTPADANGAKLMSGQGVYTNITAGVALAAGTCAVTTGDGANAAFAGKFNWQIV